MQKGTVGTLSPEDENSKSPFILSPNPAHNKLKIEILGDYEPSNVEIYNLNGQKIRKYEMNINSQEINLLNLNPGLYLIEIKTKTKSFVHKIIKI